MISSDAFNFINVLDKAADSSWTRETVIVNNLANVDTPGFKRQDVEFESILKDELTKIGYNTLTKAVKGINDDLDALEGVTYTDYEHFSYRLDGNNVDVDTENVELASEQIRYEALTSSISQEFARFNTVLK